MHRHGEEILIPAGVDQASIDYQRLIELVPAENLACSESPG